MHDFFGPPGNKQGFISRRKICTSNTFKTLVNHLQKTKKKYKNLKKLDHCDIFIKTN